MKNKIFIPKSWLLIFTIIAGYFPFFLGFCYLTIALIWNKTINIFLYLFLVILLLGILILFVLIGLQYTIIVKVQNITMWGLGKKKRDINTSQYYCEIEYSKIQSIDIIPSKKDSLDKKIIGPAAITINEYLEFTMIDNSKKRFDIFYFSKKQMRKILTIVVDKMKSLGNENYKNINIDDLIEKQWNTYQEYKRKYLKKK